MFKIFLAIVEIVSNLIIKLAEYHNLTNTIFKWVKNTNQILAILYRDQNYLIIL